MYWLISAGIYVVSAFLLYLEIRLGLINDREPPDMQEVYLVFFPGVNTVLCCIGWIEFFRYLDRKNDLARKFFKL